MKGLQILNKNGQIGIGHFETKYSVENGTEVRLLASALNHRDVWITKGKYPGIKAGVILGSDGVGEFNGETVIINPGLEWGKSELCQSGKFTILGMPFNGTFADSCFVPNAHIHTLPRHLSVFEGAALPLAGVTAYRSLFVKGDATSDSVIFINGLGGGVALMACQMALALGCSVYGTSGSDWKIEKAESLGVKKVFNYNDDEWINKFKAICDGADIIIDSAGGKYFSNLLKIANPGGRIVTYGGTLGKIENLSPQIIFWKQLSIMGSTMGSPTDFINMLEFVSQYKVFPIIDEIIPLSEAPRGFKKMEDGHQFGKIVFDHDL